MYAGLCDVQYLVVVCTCLLRCL